MLGVGQHLGFSGSQLCVGRDFVRFRKSQLGMIAQSNTISAVGDVGLAPGCGHFAGFGRG